MNVGNWELCFGRSAIVHNFYCRVRNAHPTVKQLKTRFLEKTGFLKSIPKSDLLSRISEK